MNSTLEFTIDGNSWNWLPFTPGFNGYFGWNEISYQAGKGMGRGRNYAPSYVILAHEMQHAIDFRSWGKEKYNIMGDFKEFKAVQFGNYMRTIYTQGFRSYYSGIGLIATYDNSIKVGNFRLKDYNTEVDVAKFEGNKLKYFSIKNCK